MRLVRPREPRFALILLWLVAAALPALAGAATVVTFDLRNPETTPFPSNRFATLDTQNLTRLRVNLPKPNCNDRPSDCQDVEVLNTLDGFNVQPRLRIPFSGPIDYREVNSSNVFLLRLPDFDVADTRTIRVIGINQVVWDPMTNVLYAETDELLEPRTTHLLIVTTDIKDTTGAFLAPGDFASFLNNPTQYRFADSLSTAYQESLFAAVQRSGVALARIAAASLFTTMSTTAEMEKIRDQVRASTVPPVELSLTPGGPRTVFALDGVSSITILRQVSSVPGIPPIDDSLPLALLGPMAKHVSDIGYGRYRSPLYQTPQQFIPPIATRSGVPVVQGTATVHFTLFVPAGPKPETGWPVAIYGHGLGSNKDTLLAFAAVLASRGFLTIGINVVGHGGGPLGTITVNGTNGSTVTLSAGGRGFDQNGDGNINTLDLVEAASPRGLIGNRDSLRQTVVDLMQLVRILETTGIDLDGDGSCDINSSSLHYFGISLGGMYGSMLLALDPSLRAGASNVGGGALVEAGRLGVFRSLIPGISLANRVPSLLNLPSVPPNFSFNENMPLRNQPPLSNSVRGAIAIQDYLERREWAAQTGDALAYMRHVRRAPLAGNVAKHILFQFAKGDQTVPNPAASALIRAGALNAVATYFRTDLAVAANRSLPRDPHTFMAGLIPATVPFALAMQTQIAEFFASNGEKVIDPDAGGTLFELPIVGPLPETLNFIP